MLTLPSPLVSHPSRRYDFSSLLTYMLSYLEQRFPAELSNIPSSDTFVMNWLALSDDLQLESLR